MAYIVAAPCVTWKYTDSVDVCPDNRFYAGKNFLVNHPDECIDCGACEPVCPSKAIFPESDLPEKWKEYKQLNADLVSKWPNIAEKKAPLADADAFKDKEGKRADLDMAPGH
jgi:ferredoxin